MAAGKTNIVSSQLDAEIDVAIIEDLHRDAVHRMPVGMWSELRRFTSKRCDDVNEVMRFDRNHVGEVRSTYRALWPNA